MRTMKWMMYWKRPLKANRRRKQKSEEAATDEPENEAVDAATNEPENENVHERGREWKDVHTGIKLRSLARENSPFARDIEFVPILKRLQFQNEDITLETILALHKAVMETDGQNEAAGQIRTCNVRVGRFNPMDHTRVPAAMSIFIEWLRVQMAAGQMSAGELSARAQCRLVHIHPFLDGEGRTSRLLMNLILTRRHFNPVVVPEEKRQMYYRLIERCNKRKYKDIRFICFLQQCAQNLKQNFPNKKMLKLHS